MIVCSLIIIIYAVIGINCFKGQFYHCVINDEILKANNIPFIITKEQCLENDGRWVNQERNFDNMLNSLSVLCEIITTEGWLDVMYQAMDRTGVGLQPVRNNAPINALYFITFIIIGNIFILNLFVGIVIDKFNRLKDKMCGYG